MLVKKRGENMRGKIAIVLGVALLFLVMLFSGCTEAITGNKSVDVATQTQLKKCESSAATAAKICEKDKSAILSSANKYVYTSIDDYKKDITEINKRLDVVTSNIAQTDKDILDISKYNNDLNKALKQVASDVNYVRRYVGRC